jgi:YndJ-like protein
MNKPKNSPLLAGIVVWCTYLFLFQPGMMQHEWAECILLLAALVLLQILPGIDDLRTKWLVFGAAVALAFSFALEDLLWSPALALPWLAVTVWQFSEGVQFWFRHGNKPWAVAQASGRIFMVVGGLWTLSDRLGWQPLGFSKEIVLLTGVHFHFAGLFFPMLTGLIAQKWPHRLTDLACWLVVISVPMTAIGITLAQIQWSYLFETLAAATVAVAGWLTAIRYFQVANVAADLPLSTRILWNILAFSLLFTMTLAFGYAIRPYYSFPILDIPVMRAWHGSLNAFGVATAGLLGWEMMRRKTT